MHTGPAGPYTVMTQPKGPKKTDAISKLKGGRSMKTAGRRRSSRSSRRNSLSAMLSKPLKMLMGKKTRKHRSRR